MFLLIDNFDSFTFNLVQLFQGIGADPLVLRNADPQLLALATDPHLEGVVLSPGPSHPANTGLCLPFLQALPPQVPVLGVCLGHQTLAHFAGAPVGAARRIMHGKTSLVTHDGTDLFAGLPNPVEVGRYHSLAVLEAGPLPFAVTARADDGEIMGITFPDRPWFGVQFHPESVLTPHGPTLLANFLTLMRRTA